MAQMGKLLAIKCDDHRAYVLEREMTAKSCPLASTHVLWLVHTHAHMHSPTNKRTVIYIFKNWHAWALGIWVSGRVEMAGGC